MSDEKAVYISPMKDWKIIKCEGLWGITKYEVEYYDAFWRSIYDGKWDLKSCFRFLNKSNVISKDEMKFELKKFYP